MSVNPASDQLRIEHEMEALADGAPRLGRSVRDIARWSHNSGCGTNNALFAARVDSDRLLLGTSFEPEFGQSPFAIARGVRTEAFARANGYSATFALLREHFGYATREVVPLDLRHGFPPNALGLARRHRATVNALAAIIRGDRDAPNVIDGAVLQANLGGHQAYLEADDIGAKAGPVLHAGEIKGWPVVDGRADDSGKLGDALRQMGIYRQLTMDLVEQVGGDAEVVSPSGLLITPRNVGMTLMGSVVDLRRPTAVAATTLATLPDPRAFAGLVPPSHGFGLVADVTRSEAERLQRLDELIDTFGNRYADSCTSNCPLSRFCRSRASAGDDPAVAGVTVVRMLPRIRSLTRAAALSQGAVPTAEEASTGAPELLRQAAILYANKTA